MDRSGRPASDGASASRSDSVRAGDRQSDLRSARGQPRRSPPAGHEAGAVDPPRSAGSPDHRSQRTGGGECQTSRPSRSSRCVTRSRCRYRRWSPTRATGKIIDLTRRVAGDGGLDWVAPPGTWTIYGVFLGWHGKLVERAAPGGEGNVIDHFSRDALRTYLGRFDAAFTGRSLDGLRAFFNDSYEVDDADGQANGTLMLFDEFERRRGYDLRQHLPALFGSDTSDTGARIAADYRLTVADLLHDNFTEPWRAWARRRGAIVRNQAHGSPGNLLDLYAASDIPETEGTEIPRFKWASSAAHVAGRRLISAEAATWLGEHFRSTLADVREAIDRFFVAGVNHHRLSRHRILTGAGAVARLAVLRLGGVQSAQLMVDRLRRAQSVRHPCAVVPAVRHPGSRRSRLLPLLRCAGWRGRNQARALRHCEPPVARDRVRSRQ